MNFTFNQLQILITISKTGSVTKAAEKLNLTQPAVSIQLKNLQEQFEIPLTEVIGRKIYITEFGNEIVKVAENIMEQVYAIDFKTQAYKGLLTGKLKISVVSTGKYVMPYFLSGFIKKYSSIELAMDVTNKRKVIENIEKNEVDFSLVSILPEEIDVNSIELLKNRLFLVGSKNSPVYEKWSIQKVFEKMPLIFRESGSGTRQAMESFFKSQQLAFVKKMELTSNEAVKQAVLAGLGYSIMPEIGIKNELRNGDIKIIPIKGLPIETSWQLIWRKEKKHAPVAQAFLDYITSERNKIVANHFKA